MFLRFGDLYDAFDIEIIDIYACISPNKKNNNPEKYFGVESATDVNN